MRHKKPMESRIKKGKISTDILKSQDFFPHTCSQGILLGYFLWNLDRFLSKTDWYFLNYLQVVMLFI